MLRLEMIREESDIKRIFPTLRLWSVGDRKEELHTFFDPLHLLAVLGAAFHLILTATLGGRYYCILFQGDETESCKVKWKSLEPRALQLQN